MWAGCAYKLFKKEVIEEIKDKFNIEAQHFGSELMLLTILYGFSFVEIQVNYYKRVGKSSIIGDKFKTFILAIKTLNLVAVYFFKNLFILRGKKD